MGRSRTWKLLAAALVLLAAAAGAAWWTRGGQEPVKVGILHSLTGTMAFSETAVVDATLFAIEEINARGGLLGGRRIVPVVADGRSDWPTFAAEAERLITREAVSVVFGCWTSASRKTVRPVFEKHGHLLFYPVQYEGLETSPAIVYTGAAPNQQIIPAVKWAMDKLGTRFYLVGSDYVFPRTANAIIKDQVAALRGAVVGEDYLLLGATDMDAVVARIAAAKPDVILNTINGDSNIAFFRALRAAGITAAAIPTISFSIAEGELQTMTVAELAGDYAAWNYFQSVDTPENRGFVERFRARFGAGRVTSDPMEAAYLGVHLWAQAVEKAGRTDPQAVREAAGNQSFPAPEGVVVLDPETRHTWKGVRIGRIRTDGQFDVVWDSGKPIRPVPYPVYRSKADWDHFLDGLYTGWNGHWANPGTAGARP